MWKLTSQAKGMEPLPGVPWRDMEDDEFREIAKMYANKDGEGGFPAQALHHSGFFEHVEDKDKPAKEGEA